MNYNNVEILLVEDNDFDAELTIHALDKCNMAKNLIRLSDGQEALDFIFGAGTFAGTRDIACPPKLVLLDINMPRINGLQVLQRIKCSPLTKTIPVIILTSSTIESDIQHCYNMGANSYIIKPLDYEKFALMIKDIAKYWLTINQATVIDNFYLM